MDKNRLHRGKRIDTNTWVIGYYFKQDDAEYIRAEDGVEYQIRKDTAGQYVQTVSGVDYFELDIVEHYMDGCLELPEYYLIKDIRSYFRGHMGYKTFIKNMGNIVDNPEKLKWVEDDATFYEED